MKWGEGKRRVIDLHMAHPDWTASRIAAEMGVIREYIAATARRNGLTLPKHHAAEKPRPRAPEARLGYSGIEVAGLRQIRDCGIISARKGLDTVRKFQRLLGLGLVKAWRAPVEGYVYIQVTDQGRDVARRLAI